MTDLTPEEIQQLVSRDKRLQDLDTRLLIEKELRESRSVQLVIQHLKDDALRAALALADANPADTVAITNLVATARGYAYIRRVLDSYIQLGKQAEAALRDEDH